jgi:S-DNA-T family DNA segregation ATPase FtsK/SpoIIIE
MNSIIISLLYKATPDEVKLIMIDPKMVELVNYNGIPHLLIPVVTDPKKAAGSLQWAVTEMMRRYKAMSDAGVRDLESYNSIMESQQEPNAKLAQVVVVIDELADLMLVAAKEVEESICRIAQMGRAAGIHLVIATQRPSADVITGLMKANIPSHIAFSVASAMESRIILDTQGAEKLVGKGDMLYAPIGSGKPRRVQGCFVSDAEVEAVAAYVKENFSTDYDEQVMEEIEKKAMQTGSKQTATASDPEPNSDEIIGDEMLPAAVDVILETGQASVSMLQRRLKLGYARAARIVDEMEERGIVGPFVGSKPRSILVTKEQWERMKNGQPIQMDFDDLEDSQNPIPEEE